ILMYLFETYLDDDQSEIPSADNIRNELSRIGFDDSNVDKSFKWLDDLSTLKEYNFTIEQLDNNSFRTFSSIESSTFDQQAQAVLIELVNLNILTPTQREIIIDKALALDIAPINQEQMKWVVLMVLFNMPDSAGSFTWIQDLLYQEFPTIH
ncbi:MAG: DUF494 domain-containing protein, partial [Proteobacteria bacterium]|nr:DUF494 domain-containing protein [Pseudomonadota bacterium]